MRPDIIAPNERYCHTECRYQKFCGHVEEDKSCPIRQCFSDLEFLSNRYKNREAGIYPVLRYEVAHPALAQIQVFSTLEKAMKFVKTVGRENKLKKFFSECLTDRPPARYLAELVHALTENPAELKKIMGWGDDE